MDGIKGKKNKCGGEDVKSSSLVHAVGEKKQKLTVEGPKEKLLNWVFVYLVGWGHFPLLRLLPVRAFIPPNIKLYFDSFFRVKESEMESLKQSFVLLVCSTTIQRGGKGQTNKVSFYVAGPRWRERRGVLRLAHPLHGIIQIEAALPSSTLLHEKVSSKRES